MTLTPVEVQELANLTLTQQEFDMPAKMVMNLEKRV